jgi:uncharacterized protein (DUF2336 family)
MTNNTAFPHIDGLFDLACRSGVDIRPTLLRVLTDLYVQKVSHSAEEKAQFTELAKRLIDSVDPVTRAAVAGRLAGYRHTPPEILAQLGNVAPDLPESAPAPKPPAEDDLTETFFAADIFERRLILLNLDAIGTRTHSRPPAPETCRRLEEAALAGKIDDFARILESALLLPRSVADRIVQDPFGEPIAVAARALGMSADALQRVLLFINPAIGQSVARVYELANLYGEITSHAAETMISIWRGHPVRQRRPAHQPALYDDEQRAARAAATPSRYRSVRRSDALAARFKNSGR